MTISLGGVALAEPKMGHEGLEWRFVNIAATHELYDGSIAQDFTNSRWHIALRWVGLTTSEQNTIRAQFVTALTTVSAFVDPDLGDSKDVLSVPGSMRRSAATDSSGDPLWDVEIQLAEVS